MRLSASTCYLVSLVATLVLVATSLPQSPSGRCLRVPAIDSQHDIGGKLVKRDDSQSRSEPPVRMLEPRDDSDLICGQIRGGGRSETFQFTTKRPIRMTWKFENNGAGAYSQIVQIRRLNPFGDRLVAEVRASHLRLNFKPLANAFYYIILSGSNELLMTWTFAFF